MGATDAGYLGADLSTPNLDKLATEGLKLENYYVQQLCTPTRTQLLTGTNQTPTKTKKIENTENFSRTYIFIRETKMC